jgi:hypothetical protein
MKKDFLTVKDLACELDITEKKIRELLKNKILPSRKIAGKYFVSRDKIKKFFEEGED